jgi:hypothetical protein
MDPQTFSSFHVPHDRCKIHSIGGDGCQFYAFAVAHSLDGEVLKRYPLPPCHKEVRDRQRKNPNQAGQPTHQPSRSALTLATIDHCWGGARFRHGFQRKG